jgi:hypothetical protein
LQGDQKQFKNGQLKYRKGIRKCRKAWGETFITLKNFTFKKIFSVNDFG